MKSVVRGCGAALPERVVSNDELSARLDTSDEWIKQRTGIAQRHVAGPGETTGTLALAAGQQALAAAGIGPEGIDLVVVATTTPDDTFPATAAKLQAALGIGQGAAYDVQAVCSGFLFALVQADNAIRLGQARAALVVGADTFSRILNWEDRGTAVLFGDGAGAVVIAAAADVADGGIISHRLGTDGRRYDILKTTGGPSSTGGMGLVEMNGREVFKMALAGMSGAVGALLERGGFTGADVDWLVAHQANKRIIDVCAQKMGLPDNKVILCVDQHANTSAASIPLALEHGVRTGLIKPGQLLALAAAGGGFTWGAALVRW